MEAAKATEKQHRTRVTDGIPAALPALLYADKVLDRLERAGTPVAPPDPDAGIGDALLAVVDRARAEGVDPEQALRDAVRRRLTLTLPQEGRVSTSTPSSVMAIVCSLCAVRQPVALRRSSRRRR